MSKMANGRVEFVSYMALAIILAFSSAAPAAAQSDEATEADDGSVVRDIVVTAQRRDERLSRVPISVQAVTGDQLASAGIADTRMLETISPSVTFTGGFMGGATSLSIRGVSSQTFEGGIQPSTALVIDGVPVARQNEFLFDFSDIARVEVLSGPQGTLFGKNATAGVVSVVTKKPTYDFEGYVEGIATTDDEYSIRGTINVPVSEGVAARLTGFYRDQAPLVKNIGSGPDAYGSKTYGVSGRLLVDLSSDASLLLSGAYSHSRNSYTSGFIVIPISGPLGVLQTQIVGPDLIGRGKRTVNQDGYPYNTTENWNVTAEFNWDISDEVSLVSVTGYRNSLEFGDIDADATPIGVSRGTGFTPNPLGYPLMWVNVGDDHIIDKLKYASQELRLNYSDHRVNVIGGVFMQTFREHRTSIQSLVLAAGYLGLPAPTPPDTQFYVSNDPVTSLKDDTAAVFGDVTYKVTPTFNLFAGLRYTIESLNLDYFRNDYFNPVTGFLDPVTLTNSAPPSSVTDFEAGRTDRNVSGRVGVQWQPTAEQNYYASFNRGYKGAAAHLAVNADAIDAIIKPETGSAFELGMKQRLFGGRLSIDLALYRQRINNIQQNSLAPNSFVNNLINAGQLRSDGVELNATAVPVRGLTISLGTAYTDARYNGGRFACNPTEIATSDPKCDLVSGTKSLTGEQAYGTPKVKITSSVNYETDLTDSLKIFGHAAYAWQSSVQYQLGDDPLTREPKRGILNLSMGVKTEDDRFGVTLFVNNVTNKFYYNYLNHADFFIARSFGNVARDFRRYAGIRLRYGF